MNWRRILIGALTLVVVSSICAPPAEAYGRRYGSRYGSRYGGYYRAPYYRAPVYPVPVNPYAYGPACGAPVYRAPVYVAPNPYQLNGYQYIDEGDYRNYRDAYGRYVGRVLLSDIYGCR